MHYEVITCPLEISGVDFFDSETRLRLRKILFTDSDFNSEKLWKFFSQEWVIFNLI